MNENENFETFAKQLCEYAMKNYVIPYLQQHGYIMSYRAQVISSDSNTRTMVIQRPFDNQITLPYSDGAAGLTAGDQCIVFSLGQSLNSTVVSDGKLSTL